jgi:ATP-dependent helicase/nuclease subunit B
VLLDRHRRELPDLSRHVALFPHSGAIPRFRERLLVATEARGHGGVLAPWCGTLDGWLEQTESDVALLDDTERELLLLEALESYPALRERFGTWPLIDSLLALFDELNAHRSLAATDVVELTALLAAGYRADATIPPLRGEAELVHTLWSGWNAHLASHGAADRGLHRLMGLVRRQKDSDHNRHHIYMVGGVELTPPQARWLKPLLLRQQATLILHGGSPGLENPSDAAIKRCFVLLDLPPPALAPITDPYTKFIDTVYATEPDIAARARAFAATTPASPLAERLHVHAAADFEQEARAVDLAVRRWYAAGISAIGIVTPDRKLARRVRALLERAGLALRDSAGWALSTTSAATAVMRWLECVEQDFAQAPLLDFLKSPFVTLGLPQRQLEAIAHCFEEEIVRRHNVSGGLDRYRRVVRAWNPRPKAPALADDVQDISEPAAGVSRQQLLDMLDRLAAAAEPLSKLLRGRPRSPFAYLSALQQSLERTGLATRLGADAAGSQLLAALRPTRRALGTHGASLSWPEFHHWLRRELERRRFRPPLPETGVDLLDLADSRARRFDALIIAGCTRENLPGGLTSSPFFNDGVRRQLGLPTRQDRLLAPLHDFRRLLEAAPRVLLTWRETEDGEAVVPSPWTERLVAFHRLAYGTAPEDTELRALLAIKETQLYRHDGSPLPGGVTRPTPRLPGARIPAVLWANAHQRLLDCPYQFYVVDGLGLRSLDDVRDEMEKSDYGQSVHRILHAFHTGVPGLPGPWTGGPIQPGNRADAAELLNQLGRAVFGHDTDKRLSTRGWGYRWERFVAIYLDWQEKRGRDWQIEATEKTFEREIDIGERTLVLKGRADRIDRGPEGLAIIDYKTGAVPDLPSVRTGEEAQLSFYALLHPDAIAEVLYAKLEPDAIKTSGVKGNELTQLVRLLEIRVRALVAGIDRGESLPAWGDASTCIYCRYEGLCRKEMWSESDVDRDS